MYLYPISSFRSCCLVPTYAKYDTKEINNRVPQGFAYGVGLAPGPNYNGRPGGSHEFSGTENGYIEISSAEVGPLDVRYSIIMLYWVYSEGRDGPLFNYLPSGQWGVHLWVGSGKLFARFNKRAFTKPLTTTYLTRGWKFVGASYDCGSGEAKLWVNGDVVVTKT